MSPSLHLSIFVLASQCPGNISQGDRQRKPNGMMELPVVRRRRSLVSHVVGSTKMPKMHSENDVLNGGRIGRGGQKSLSGNSLMDSRASMELPHKKNL